MFLFYCVELFEHATVFFTLFIDKQVSYLTIHNLKINQWRARRLSIQASIYQKLIMFFSLLCRVWYDAELFENATVFFILFIDKQVYYLTIHNLTLEIFRKQRWGFAKHSKSF